MPKALAEKNRTLGSASGMLKLSIPPTKTVPKKRTRNRVKVLQAKETTPNTASVKDEEDDGEENLMDFVKRIATEYQRPKSHKLVSIGQVAAKILRTPGGSAFSQAEAVDLSKKILDKAVTDDRGFGIYSQNPLYKELSKRTTTQITTATIALCASLDKYPDRNTQVFPYAYCDSKLESTAGGYLGGGMRELTEDKRVKLDRKGSEGRFNVEIGDRVIAVAADGSQRMRTIGWVILIGWRHGTSKDAWSGHRILIWVEQTGDLMELNMANYGSPPGLSTSRSVYHAPMSKENMKLVAPEVCRGMNDAVHYQLPEPQTVKSQGGRPTVRMPAGTKGWNYITARHIQGKVPEALKAHLPSGFVVAT